MTLDKLVVELILNAVGFEKGTKKAKESIKDVGNESEKTGNKVKSKLNKELNNTSKEGNNANKSLSNFSKDASKGFEELAIRATKFLGILGGAIGIESFTRNTFNANAQLNRFSRSVAESPEKVKALENTVEQLSGSSSGVDEAIKSISTFKTEMINGHEPAQQYLEVISKLHLKFDDIKKKSPIETLKDISSHLKELDKLGYNFSDKVNFLEPIVGRNAAFALASKGFHGTLQKEEKAEHLRTPLAAAAEEVDKKFIKIKQRFLDMLEAMVVQGWYWIELVIANIHTVIADWDSFFHPLNKEKKETFIRAKENEEKSRDRYEKYRAMVPVSPLFDIDDDKVDKKKSVTKSDVKSSDVSNKQFQSFNPLPFSKQQTKTLEKLFNNKLEQYEFRIKSDDDVSKQENVKNYDLINKSREISPYIPKQNVNNSTTHFNGDITINTQAKDAMGIVEDLKNHTGRSFSSQSNNGLS